MSQSTSAEPEAPSGTHHPLTPTPHHVHDDLTLLLHRTTPGLGPFLPASEGRWVRHVRHVCAARLHHRGLPPQLIDDVELLVTELTTNALQHTRSDTVSVQLLVSHHLIVIEVFDGSPSHAGTATAGPEDENGRGMTIVAGCADAWGVSPDGTRTWCALFRAGR
ncbi:ATP-binding protein [Streptomyces sp. NPDC004610]|uniref:ATP-binding protein n=1 Tax=unclassified Streptomyces TaxID=2593676 RepID=UPI0033BACBD1